MKSNKKNLKERERACKELMEAESFILLATSNGENDVTVIQGDAAFVLANAMVSNKEIELTVLNALHALVGIHRHALKAATRKINFPGDPTLN